MATAGIEVRRSNPTVATVWVAELLAAANRQADELENRKTHESIQQMFGKITPNTSKPKLTFEETLCNKITKQKKKNAEKEKEYQMTIKSKKKKKELTNGVSKTDYISNKQKTSLPGCSSSEKKLTPNVDDIKSRLEYNAISRSARKKLKRKLKELKSKSETADPDSTPMQERKKLKPLKNKTVSDSSVQKKKLSLTNGHQQSLTNGSTSLTNGHQECETSTITNGFKMTNTTIHISTKVKETQPDENDLQPPPKKSKLAKQIDKLSELLKRKKKKKRSKQKNIKKDNRPDNLIAYGLLKALSLNTAFAFGMFAFGCSPSGSASNAWTVILKGDLDLSLFVTFVSTVAALGMMPLWLFTLGKTLVHETIKIPYKNIMLSLVSLIVPVVFGVLIHRCLPKVAKFLIRLVKPASALFLLYVCTFGLYVNAFMFKLLNWRILVAGLIMPCCTFFLGALVAGICRLTYKRIITIAIETAIQNTGIALVMMLATLPKPDGDIAAIMPIIGSVFTPVPLLLALTGSCIYGKYIGAKKENSLIICEKGNNEIKNMASDPYQNNNFMNSCPT